jgi:hypothetical protein
MQFQARDLPLSACKTLEIRHQLKYHHQAKQIFITDFPNLTEINKLHIDPPPEPIPRFVSSQLKAQNIADLTTRSPQVSAILLVTSRFLARCPFEDAASATLFLWHSPDHRRTHCLFVYLVGAMPSRSYTVAELLELRGPQNSHHLQNRLEMNPDLGKLKDIHSFQVIYSHLFSMVRRHL